MLFGEGVNRKSSMYKPIIHFCMPAEAKKKISAIVSSDIIRQMEDAGLTQTEAVTEALKYYFSEDMQKIRILFQSDFSAKRIRK